MFSVSHVHLSVAVESCNCTLLVQQPPWFPGLIFLCRVPSGHKEPGIKEDLGNEDQVMNVLSNTWILQESNFVENSHTNNDHYSTGGENGELTYVLCYNSNSEGLSGRMMGSCVSGDCCALRRWTLKEFNLSHLEVDVYLKQQSTRAHDQYT